MIDATGTLDGGFTFEGPAELKAYLMEHRKDAFLKNVSERILSFALGRQLQYFDAPTIEAITRAVADDNYSAATLVEAVVLSYPFGHQNNRPALDGPSEVSLQLKDSPSQPGG